MENEDLGILRLSYGNFVLLDDYIKLRQENQQLKEQIEKLQFDLEYEKENLRFSKDYAKCLEEKLKQRDEVIDKAINKLGKYADEMANNGNAYAICVDLLDTLKKYKGDNNDGL